MYKCTDVANYFLKSQDFDSGEFITNLKLQKLVYYAQGIYLALKDKPLFSEEIKAWDNGPVCVPLFHMYKHLESDPIPIPVDVDVSETFTKEDREIIDRVYDYYGQFSAWKLRDMSHEDDVWIKAYKKSKGVISHDEMREYFKTQLEDDE